MILYIQNEDKPNTTIRQENSKTMNKIKRLEKMYGVTIRKENNNYSIYTADNNLWISGLKDFNMLSRECKDYEIEFRVVKRYIDARNNMERYCLHNVKSVIN